MSKTHLLGMAFLVIACHLIFYEVVVATSAMICKKGRIARAPVLGSKPFLFNIFPGVNQIIDSLGHIMFSINQNIKRESEY